jgi:hypothetical protein
MLHPELLDSDDIQASRDGLIMALNRKVDLLTRSVAKAKGDGSRCLTIGVIDAASARFRFQLAAPRYHFLHRGLVAEMHQPAARA